MSKLRVLTVAGLMAATLISQYGCGPECGDGLVDKDGQCVVAAKGCGDGTVLLDGQCELDTGGCGEGAMLAGGACVPAAEACSEGASLDESSGQCVPNTDIVCGAGTEAGADGWCTPSATVCGDKTQLDDNGRCVITAAVCGTGTELDPNSGECLLVDEACGAGLALDADSGECVASAEICDLGTKFDDGSGLCLPDSCREGDVLIGTVCMSPAEELARHDDSPEVENNDPALGGTPQQLLVDAVGADPFVFTGTIGAPADLDADGQDDQDVDVFTFEAQADQWLQLMVQSLGLQSPAFKIEGPNGFVRYSPVGSSHGAARDIIIPEEGTYTVTVLPSVLLDAAGDEPLMGSDEWGYVGSLKAIAAPTSPIAVDMTSGQAELTGEYRGLTDNYFELTNLQYGQIVRLEFASNAAGVDGLIRAWSPTAELIATTPTETTPTEQGAAVDFVADSSSVMVQLDWIALRGADSSFRIDALISGGEELITILPGGSQSQTVTADTGDKIVVSHTNSDDVDLNVVVTNPVGTVVASEAALAPGDTLSVVAGLPGDYTATFVNETDENVDATLTAKLAAPSGLGQIPAGVTRTTGPFELGPSATYDVEFTLGAGEVARIGQQNTSNDAIDYTLFDASGSVVRDDSSFSETDDGIDEPDDFTYVYSEAGGTYTFSVWNDSSYNPITGQTVSITNLGAVLTDMGRLESGQSFSHQQTSSMVRDEVHFFRFDAATDGMMLLDALTPNGEDIDVYVYEGGFDDDYPSRSTTASDESYADDSHQLGETIVMLHAWSPLPSYTLDVRLNPAPPASADFSSRPQVTVPDGGPEGKAGITDTLTATGCVAIDAVSVYVDITHGDPMDLEMHLTSPNGTTIRLSTGSGPTRDDRIGWFPQQIEPSESLNVFEDEYGNGEWILRVIDDNSDYNDTAGTWNEWGLALTCK